MKLTTIALSLIGTILLAGCGPSGDSAKTEGTTGGGGSAGGNLTIAVIPKGTTHSYWQSVKAGAEAAAKEFGATIQFKGPLKEDDRAGQIQVVQQFVADKVAGIVLAPLDNNALVPAVKSAMDAKIPVTIIDSSLTGTAGTDFTAYVATNNKAAGSLGGEELAKVLGGKGKVVLLRYAEGSASTMEREAGFLEAIAKYPDIQVVSQDQYSGATQSEAQSKAMQMVDVLKGADGVFTPNESSSRGMLLALNQMGLAGKIRFVGFDMATELLDGVKAGTIQGVVAQNPTKMGYESVKATIKKIKGETIETNVDTGATVITKENIEQPDIQKLIKGE